MTTELWVTISAMAVVFFVIYILVRWENKRMSDENIAHRAYLQIEHNNALFELKKQNQKFQNELAEANLDFAEQIKKDLIHTKLKPLEGATIVLSNNEDQQMGFKVIKVRHDSIAQDKNR